MARRGWKVDAGAQTIRAGLDLLSSNTTVGDESHYGFICKAMERELSLIMSPASVDSHTMNNFDSAQ